MQKNTAGEIKEKLEREKRLAELKTQLRQLVTKTYVYVTKCLDASMEVIDLYQEKEEEMADMAKQITALKALLYDLQQVKTIND